MGSPRKALSVFDAVAIVVGIVVGAGIFRLPSLVAGNVGDSQLILATWVAGGIIALIGALCYAELATTYPNAGGEYHFLTLAYGRDVGFMFAWARMTVLQTGSIAVLAYVFGDFAAQLLSFGPYSGAIYAALAVALVTLINIAGVRQMTSVQAILFSLTLIGLIGIIVAGLAIPEASNALPQAEKRGTGDSAGAAALGLAMIFVLFTFGGWNEAAYLSAELKNNARNMVRALVLGIVLITLLYLAVNTAYLNVLGPGGMANSDAVASDLVRAVVGSEGAVVITVLVMIVVFASLNVTVFTGGRTNFALGRDFTQFRFLSRWSDKGSAPVHGLLFQGGIALGLVGLGLLGRNRLETVVDYLAPVFWFFFLLTGIALFVLRWRDPDTKRPFRVPLYPVTPIIFCVVSGYLLYASLNYTGFGALVGIAVLLAGLPFLFWIRRTRRPADNDGEDIGSIPSSEQP